MPYEDLLVVIPSISIGDLILLTPAFRARASISGRPLRLAVSEDKFPLLVGSDFVTLISLADLKTGRYPGPGLLYLEPSNLTAYELRNRPFVKMSRIEIFAKAMGVRRQDLDRFGWRPDIPLFNGQLAAAKAFLSRKKLGRRPVLGIEPQSRAPHLNYPRIRELIFLLSRDYDVIVFQYGRENVLSGPGIVTTTTLSLEAMLGLVPLLAAFVGGDGDWIHAADAFEVPILAFFGPTDANVILRRDSQNGFMQNTADFSCSPCWRDATSPCVITGQAGVSPCLSTFSVLQIKTRVDALLADKP